MPSEKSLSKFISLLLRHDPGAAGLELDAQGWASIKDLCSALHRRGQRCSLAWIEDNMATADKIRWELSPDKKRIRATHGHSVEIVFDYQPATPPDVLYHGTVKRFLASIGAHGLVCGERQFVHMSSHTAGAAEVARRRGKAVVLTIDAARMAADGHTFYCSASDIWLTAHVPPTYLTFPA
jgi:putative RNA 2'-phosphotransferase